MKLVSANQTGRLRLRITAAAETAVRSGHPWIFSDSILESNRAGKTGELAVVFDRKNKFLAIGFFDADSPIRVRVLHVGKPQTIDSDWWKSRLEKSLAIRRDLFDTHTNGFRLIHGESDGWPGLVLDKYDSTIVLKIYSAAWLPRLAEILALFKEKISCERIVLRLSRNIQTLLSRQSAADISSAESSQKIKSADCKSAARLNYFDGQMLFGLLPNAPVIFLENGIRFEANVLRGQKTGFFLDQRENRFEVEKLARGKKVLNAFSFSGGFSIYAARGGAKSVTDLDISAHALESAKRNFALNQNFPGVASCRHEIIQADAFNWLEKTSAQFDLIVLDPPSLAKRESERATAIHAYEKLNSLGMTRLLRDGILIAGSCSAHVSAPEFFEAVRRAAKKSGRKFVELKTSFQPQDHPATFKEAEYLKMIYLGFD